MAKDSESLKNSLLSQINECIDRMNELEDENQTLTYENHRLAEMIANMRWFKEYIKEKETKP